MRETNVDDARQPTLLDRVAVLVLAEASDPVASARVQTTVQVGVGEKHQSRDVRELLSAKCRLTSKQRLQSLGLPVGQQQRVVVASFARVARRRPAPSSRVAAQLARPTLYLDQEDALRADHKGVDLADRAVEHELKIRPGPIRLVVWQVALEKRQRVPLPRELRRRHLDPVLIHQSDILFEPRVPATHEIAEQRSGVRVDTMIIAVQQVVGDQPIEALRDRAG